MSRVRGTGNRLPDDTYPILGATPVASGDADVAAALERALGVRSVPSTASPSASAPASSSARCDPGLGAADTLEMPPLDVEHSSGPPPKEPSVSEVPLTLLLLLRLRFRKPRGAEDAPADAATTADTSGRARSAGRPSGSRARMPIPPSSPVMVGAMGAGQRGGERVWGRRRDGKGSWGKKVAHNEWMGREERGVRDAGEGGAKGMKRVGKGSGRVNGRGWRGDPGRGPMVVDEPLNRRRLWGP